MAEFLTTRGISFRLEEIIKDAEERLYLISPFLKVSKDLKELLESKRPSVDIRIIYGKSELQPDEGEWLQGLDAVKTSYRKDLHAKCYLNENTALLTSMNLYEFSERNNDEMGVLVSREEDGVLYDKIFEASKELLDKSDPVRVTVARVEAVEDSDEQPKSKTPTTAKPPAKGFCIRCKTEIPTKPLAPYCKGCYMLWKRFKNKNHKDKHCHMCGKDHEATMNKPVCRDCYSKYKNVLEFAAG